MQRVAAGAVQPAPVQGLVVFQVPDGWLHRLASLEPSPLELAPVDDLSARVGCIHAPKAQVNHDLLGLGPVSSVRIVAIGPCVCVTATLPFTSKS